MEGYKISEMIGKLEELKENYGDIRVMLPVPYTIDEKDHIDKIEIDRNNNETVVLIW